MTKQLTPEEIAAQKEADAKLKAEAKAKKEAEAKAKKEADAKAKEEAKAKKEAEAKAKKEAALADKEAKKKAAEDAKAKKLADAEAAKANREANRMPEQNGIRRPKPDTLCGKAWGHADELSAKLGQPVPIAQLLEVTDKAGLCTGNVKAEYARWRKFHGVTGRITLPKPAATTTETA